MSANNSGVLGTEYEEVERVVNRSDDDWMSFIKSNSNGLTKTGQKLFQNAIESFVYCVLGAQAQTRWRSGSKVSSNTGYLVQNTIAQGDQVKLISKDTNVELKDTNVELKDTHVELKDTNVERNMAIASGLILIPSNLIILEKKLNGYNNVLTMATSEMSFGVNEDINQKKLLNQKKKKLLNKKIFPLLIVKEICICWAVQ